MNEPAVPVLDTARMQALARRHALSLRQALVLVARRAACTEGGMTWAWLDAEIARLRAAPQAVDTAAALLALDPAAFALDDVEHALAGSAFHADAPS